jgi:30S ribosomal protein S31
MKYYVIQIKMPNFAILIKITMGRGDRRTKKGKISNGSYGKARPKKEKKFQVKQA